MRKLIDLLKSGWFITLVGLLLLAAMIWFFGPYLGIAGRQPLAGPVARLALILSLVLLWGIWTQVQHLRHRTRAQKLGSGLAAQASPGDDRQGVAAAERAQLEQRFRDAVQMLRKTRGRGSLYSLPWYMVIGPPGSGKSTLVRNSGLQFPLAAQFGKESLRGVGGTRNCDWWFTDEAVFLDTAGRYTTQDSDQLSDAGAWTDFLRLLRRFRRNRPINGVIVTMSMSDLLLLDDAERDQHVQAIRRRLDELAEQLRVRVPVYMVLTKCDLVAGFGEFFGDLNPEQRSQVWGVSFPIAKTMDGSAARTFADEFALLLDRLNNRLVERLHGERDRSRRAAILAFPQQFATIGETARQFTESVFAGHAYGPPMLLRGVYMTSGTQEGTPIDRMMGAVARTFGLDESRLHAPGMQSRTFFVERLLREVVFPESGFAGTNPVAERRKAMLKVASYGGIGLATALLLAGMGTSYMRNLNYLDQVQAALQAMPDSPRPSSATTRQQFFALALQRLEGLRTAVDTARQHDDHAPLAMRMGLFQGNAVGSQLQDAYLRELNGALLPGLAAQFRGGLAQSADDLQALYYYLKGYLMLGQPEHADAAELEALAGIEWRKLFPRDPVLQAALAGHFSALVAQPRQLRAVPLDDEQVAQARNTLRSADLSMLVYSSLKLGVEQEQAPRLRLDKELGLLGDVYRRSSGIPLSEPLPRLFTQPVFARQVDGGIDAAVEQFLEDGWVFGAERKDELGRARVAQQVLGLYEQDYIRTWDALLADMKLQPASDLPQASMIAAKLSGPGSPMRLLLKVVRENTTDMMGKPDAAGGEEEKGATVAKAASAAADAARKRAASRSAALAAVLGNQPGAAAAPAPGKSIEEHFATLNLLTEGAAGAAPIDRTLGVLDQLSKTLLTMTEFDSGQPTPQLLLAQQEAGQLPPPVSGWVASLTGKSEALVASGASEALGDQAKEAVGPDCAAFIAGRYPFDPTSNSDIPLQDFGELFGYGGRFDSLFKQSLQRLIDTSGRNWHWREGPGMSPGPAGLPARMQAADAIKRSYFRDSNMPDVRFTLRAPTLGPGVAKLVVEIDGQAFEARPGSDAGMSMRWPGPTPGQASVAAFDAAGAQLGQVVQQGDWALFRLMKAGGLARHSDMLYVARFNLGGHAVEIPLQPGSLRHPFLDAGVRRFRCGG